MLQQAETIIKSIANETDRVMLFHSASGKDSIALLDLMAPHFSEVVCVYMYVVKGLSHIARYVKYATDRYSNVRFIEVPHFALPSYHQIGFMGCEEIPNQRKLRLRDIDDKLKAHLGIEWSFYGFKQSDSLNRRLMLRGYDEEAINRDSNKCYPLSVYKNRDILHYIDRHHLIQPERYGLAQSSGTSIQDVEYLLFLREHYPSDLAKVLQVFPLVERFLFEYDYAKTITTE